VQRQEHQEMFLLLGDPATHFPAMANALKLAVSGAAKPGSQLRVSTSVPESVKGSTVRVTLERPLSSVAANLLPVPAKVDASEQRRIVLENHRRANEFVLSQAQAAVKDGRCEATIEIPRDCAWDRVILRAYVGSDGTEAMGVLNLKVERAEP